MTVDAQAQEPTRGLQSGPLSKGEVSSRRVALVIGNGGYSRGPLKNPPADAALMGETLKDLGFEVMLHQDLDQKGMFRAIQSFGEALKGEDVEVGMFFYAGHGMQIKGRNYLIPVGAELNGEEDAEIEAVDVGRVLVKMEAAKVPLSVLVLDACRDNPFARSWRSGSSGLGLTQAPPSTLVAYATAPEQVAADGVGGNSPYTQALSKHLKEPGLEIGEVMRRVGAEVRELTEGKQVPWTAGSVTHAWYPSGACPAGTISSGGRCVPRVECPEGTTLDGGRCVAQLSCPEGAVLENGRCVAQLSCPEGATLVGGQCVAPAPALVVAPAAEDAPPQESASPEQELTRSSEMEQVPDEADKGAPEMSLQQQEEPGGVRLSRVVGWSGLVVGAGGLVTTLIAYNNVSTAEDNLARLREDGDEGSDEYLLQEVQASSNQDLIYLGAGVTIVGLVTSLIAFNVDDSPPNTSSSSLGVGPGGSLGLSWGGAW